MSWLFTRSIMACCVPMLQWVKHGTYCVCVQLCGCGIFITWYKPHLLPQSSSQQPGHSASRHWPAGSRNLTLTHLPLDNMATMLADDNFKYIFFNENDRILTRISLRFVARSPIDNWWGGIHLRAIPQFYSTSNCNMCSEITLLKSLLSNLPGPNELNQ